MENSTNNKDYSPTQSIVDYFMLKGKVEAVGVYLNNESFPKPEIIAKILGLEYCKHE